MHKIVIEKTDGVALFRYCCGQTVKQVIKGDAKREGRMPDLTPITVPAPLIVALLDMEIRLVCVLAEMGT